MGEPSAVMTVPKGWHSTCCPPMMNVPLPGRLAIDDSCLAGINHQAVGCKASFQTRQGELQMLTIVGP